MDSDKRIIGHAAYFYGYSTWEGHLLFVGDLFVKEEMRGKCIVLLSYNNYYNYYYMPTPPGKGFGTALLKECSKVYMIKI